MADVDMAPVPSTMTTAPAAGPSLSAQPQPTEASALEHERDRLANALAQLERSNAELRHELDDQRAQGVPLDRDYKEALEDNLVVVAKYRARVAALEEEIRRLKSEGGGGDAFGGQPRDVGGVGVGVGEGGQERQQVEGASGAAAGGAGTGAGSSGGGANENGGGGDGGGVWV